MLKNKSDNEIQHDEIDLIELWKVLSKGKWLTFWITVFFSIAGIMYALMQPNIYRSEALLSPANETNNSGSSIFSSQIGGLANLAGVNLGNNQSNQTIRAIATIQSREFIRKFFQKHELIVPFMASKAKYGRGYVEIDPNLYNIESQTWESNSSGESLIPTDWQVYKKFTEIFIVEQDSETGLITIKLDWYDPVQIKQWVDWLVEDLNQDMKERDRIETKKAIEYLQKQLEKTALVEMKNVFYNLIESQTQVAMLSDIRDEYSLEQIDPSVVAEERISPNRSLICLLSFFLGALIGNFLVLFRFYRHKINP